MTRHDKPPASPPSQPVQGGAADSDDSGRWPVWKLSVMLYLFAATAVAINLFMLGLMWQAIGWPALSPRQVLWLSVPLGIPAAWASGLWVRRLLDEGAR